MTASAVALLSCESGSPPPPTTMMPATPRFTSMGSGPSSTEPLFPIALGARYSAQQPYVVYEARDVEAGTLYALGLTGQETNYYLEVDGDLYIVGRSGPWLYAPMPALPQPRLRVPATVRDGMAWETDTPGGVEHCRVELIPQTNAPLLHGRSWRIVCELADGPIYLLENGLIEGFGPWGATTGAVIPADRSRRSETAPRRPIALEPLADGEMVISHHCDGLSVERAWASRQAGDPAGEWRIGASGLANGDEITGMCGSRYHAHGACVATDLDAAIPENVRGGSDYDALHGGGEDACPHPDSALHGADAALEGAALAELRWFGEGLPFFDPYGPHAELLDGSGVLSAHRRSDGVVEHVEWGAGSYAGLAARAPGERDPRYLDEMGNLRGLSWSFGDIGASRYSWSGVDADGVIEMLSPNGSFLMYSRVPPRGLGQVMHPALPLEDGLATWVGDDGVVHHLRFTPDGHFERIEMGPDGPRLAPFADFAIPDGHRPVGGFLDGDSFVVLTHGPNAPGSPYARTLGGLYAFRARGSFDLTTPGTLPDPVWAVTFASLYGQRMLCWAPGHGEPDISDWTLDGGPVHVLRAEEWEGRPCAILVPDPFTLPTDRNVFRGTLPGAGRVTAVAAAGPLEEGMLPIHATVSGVPYSSSQDWRFGPTGVPRGSVSRIGDPVSSNLTEAHVDDLDGGGTWALGTEPPQGMCAELGTCVRLSHYVRGVEAEGIELSTLVTGVRRTHTLLAGLEGGGVLVGVRAESAPDHNIALSVVPGPGGLVVTEHPPIDSVLVGVEYGFPSGTYCGTSGGALRCRTPSGELRTGEPIPFEGTYGVPVPMRGHLVAGTPGQVHVLSEATLTVTTFELEGPVTDPGVGATCQHEYQGDALFLACTTGLLLRVEAGGSITRLHVRGLGTSTGIYALLRDVLLSHYAIPRALITEGPLPSCSNGIDDDGDGKDDFADPGCTSSEDATEDDPSVQPTCSNGMDDDTDGHFDYPDDPDCWLASSDAERPRVECGALVECLSLLTGDPASATANAPDTTAQYWLQLTGETGGALAELDVWLGGVSATVSVTIHQESETPGRPGLVIASGSATVTPEGAWRTVALDRPAPFSAIGSTPLYLVLELPAGVTFPYASSGPGPARRAWIDDAEQTPRFQLLRARCCG